MTIQELQEKLQIFTSSIVGAEVYFILNDDTETIIRFADIDAQMQESLRDQFIDRLRNEVVTKDNLSLLPLSSADERTNALYHYDLDETPSDLLLLDEVLNDQEISPFNFSQHNLSNIKGFLIKIGAEGHQLALYKRHYPISLLKKDSSLACLWNSTANRLVKVDSDILKINDKFDFFKYDDEIYFFNIESLEKFFGFSEIIKKEAQRGIDRITEADFLENPDFLTEHIDDLSFSRKLTKVLKTSPVLEKVTPDSVINFIKNHPTLNEKIKTNLDGTKIELHSKLSRNLFVKLLNDDYLHSELTTQLYDSLAKDSITTPEG